MAYKKSKQSSQEEEIITENNDVGALVREAEQNYLYGKTRLSKYVTRSMYDDINRIDAYLNSKHITGDKDEKGRDKPFFNIVTSAVNVWYRATDIDRKDIRVRATKASDTVKAFLATSIIQDWMRRENFGQYLNDWGRALARYGSAVSKFVEKDGRLIPSVVSWQRLIVDQIDFDANFKIETLELTEAQLYQTKGYDREMVKMLCEAKRNREDLDGTQRDNKSDYIKLYEVHGMLPLSYLTGKDEDQDEYVQQMHVISFLASEGEGEFDDFTLYSGREEKDPYNIAHLIKEDGQTLSIGAVQHLFDAQWMVNHSVKAIKDQLDLASKLVFQTADENFVGRNVLSSIQTGDILRHADNKPITQIANNSHDITALQSFGAQWKQNGNEGVNLSESLQGETAPSGTAWRQVEALLQESHSLFELMVENKALAIEEIIRKYVIPFVKKQLDTTDEVVAVLDAHEITKIDSMLIKRTAIKNVNKVVIDKIINGEDITPEEQAMLMEMESSKMEEDLSEMGNQRFFVPSDIDDSTWKDILEDLEWDLEVDISGESVDREAIVTLNTMLGVLAQNPGALQDPNIKMLFTKILNLTGAVSPLELSTISHQPSPSPVEPQEAPAPV